MARCSYHGHGFHSNSSFEATVRKESPVSVTTSRCPHLIKKEVCSSDRSWRVEGMSHVTDMQLCTNNQCQSANTNGCRCVSDKSATQTVFFFASLNSGMRCSLLSVFSPSYPSTNVNKSVQKKKTKTKEDIDTALSDTSINHLFPRLVSFVDTRKVIKIALEHATFTQGQ